MTSRSLAAGVLAASVIAFAGTASAAVTKYTNEANFNAHVTGLTTFGFDEGNTDAHTTFIANPSSFGGFTFEDHETQADIDNSGFAALILVGATATPNYGVDFLAFQNSQVGIQATITNAGVTAFGFRFGSYVAPNPFTLTLNTGDSYVITPTGTAQFVGFISDAPITSASFDYPLGYTIDITSVSSGVGSAAPEPAAWALMIAGFGLAGTMARRRRSLLA